MSARPSVTLSCLEGEQCVVTFEPWGTEHVLRRGDSLRIETAALSTAALEVSYVADGLSVCISSDDEVLVTDRSGRRMAL